MQEYEQLGRFYIGRRVDPGTQEIVPETILYDAKDLTTHAVCIGMTGSGKTGLAVTMLEEAAIDGIPVIAIDPKGDLANMMLSFPKLRPGDFLPWIDEAAAMRKGRSREEHAEFMAKLWRKGLGDWDQKPERIQRYIDAAERRVYTPGSRAGEPIAVLRSFDAPPAAIVEDAEALGDKVSGAVSGLLGLLGIDADPIRSREHILLSNILAHAWRAGENLDLAGVIRSIQAPPFDKVGVFDLESFFDADDRFALAMQLNNLLASPGFAVWTEGQPLDIQQLMYTPEGKPKVSILSIAHLDDAERMFFVATLFNEILSWTRAQSGTSSLRALVYMDEVFGYLPPSANPPSKKPLLTLLKQARAFGVGIVLSTQNPVDLDYKALSNIGTWWLGRLQTERDKARVLDGLESVAGGAMSRAEIDDMLSSLDSRIFLMHNVHEDAPVLMHTRWALNYLGGPMTREQLERLRESQPAVALPPSPTAPPTPAKRAAAGMAKAAEQARQTAVPAGPPPLPPDVPQRYLPAVSEPMGSDRLVYRPSLGARATLHHVRASAHLDQWSRVGLAVALDGKPGPRLWEQAFELESESEWPTDPDLRAAYGDLPAAARDAKKYKAWTKMLKSHLYASRALTLYKCKPLKLMSAPPETAGEFQTRLREKAREARDMAMEKLNAKYAPKLARLEERIRTAEQKVEVETEQHRQQKTNTAISIGATVLGALFGRKVKSAGTVSRASSAAKAAGRTSRAKQDIARAEEKLEALEQKLQDLEAELAEKLEELRDVTVDDYEVSEVVVAPRKADLQVEELVLLWLPHHVDAQGVAKPAWKH